MYYLQSRYYDPEVGRFVNSDAAEFILFDENLFAYCGNNPICNVDDSGFWYYTLIDYYNSSVKPWARNSKTKHKYNINLMLYQDFKKQYDKNVKILGKYSDYIYNQNNLKVASLKFGNSKIKEVGCELIAIYNIMKILGKYQYFPNVINECYMNDLDWNLGKWGMKPKKLYKYFDAHKIHYQKTENLDTWLKRVKKKKCGIASSWNGGPIYLSGLHTVAIKYKYVANSSYKERYYVYNAHQNSKSGEFFPSEKDLKTFLGKKRFIIGYTF